MDKLKLVAKHEFLKLVKSKSYIAMTLVLIFLPVLGGIVIGGIAYMSGLTSSSAVGYVDNSGIIKYIEDANFLRCDDEETARLALIDKEIGGYYVIPENYEESGKIYWYSFEGSMLKEASREGSDQVIKRNLVRGMTQEYAPSIVVERVTEPADVEQVTLDTSGEPAENQGTSESMVFGMAMGFVFIMIVMTPAGYLLTGLVREKENKVMEVLLSSVSPRQLLMGKVVGIGLAGLLQVVLVVIGDMVVMMAMGLVLGGIMATTGADTAIALANNVTGNAGIASSLALGEFSLFPQGIGVFLGMGLIYFLLGYLLFTVVLTLVGAVCNVKEQASQWQAPLMFICVMPLFVSIIWSGSPGNAVMVIMGMFPLTAPLTMIIRLSCSVVPTWELAVSVGLMLLSIGVLFWLLPRLVQGDVLIAGRNFSLKRLLGLKGKVR